MAEQKQIQKKIRFALSSQTSKENLSFVILLMLMSIVRTRLQKTDTSELAPLVELVYVLCTKSRSVLCIYPWEYTVMKFAANLNLKEHQFFLLTLYRGGVQGGTS